MCIRGYDAFDNAVCDDLHPRLRCDSGWPSLTVNTVFKSNRPRSPNGRSPRSSITAQILFKHLEDIY